MSLENHIRKLRQKAGMSQAKLAELVETSQQQIQRIEAGIQKPRFDLAVKIAAALNVRIYDVFPAAALPLARVAKRPNTKLSDIYSDDKTLDALEEAGLDMDPAVHAFKVRLRGGAELLLQIDGSERSRLWSFVQREEGDQFMIFDSGDRRYAINPSHMMFCHFLFDPPGMKTTPGDAEDEAENVLAFYLADSAEPLLFGVDPDYKSINDEAADGTAAQLQDLFFYAELGNGDRLTFKDEDGETAFFRPQDVALFSAPISFVEPELDEDAE